MRRFTILCALPFAMSLCFSNDLALQDGETFNLKKFLQKEQPISIVTEPGEKVPGLLLSEVGHYGDAQSLEWLGGPARLQGVQKQALLHDSQILPEFLPAALYRETYFLIKGKQSTLIRLVTVPAGGIAQLIEDVLYPDHPALLSYGETFAVVDENVMRALASDEGVFGGDGHASKGLCIRTPFGPGKVNWTWSTPASSGYSVKPESSSSLIWAASGYQDIDGIYRSSWGCGTALKVPNSCTVTYNSSGSYSSCCNAAMAALGYVVNFVSYEPGWPSCPL